MKNRNSYFLEEAELRAGIRVCCQKVNGLLNGVLVLVNDRGSLSLALALYTLAIEEHGKALMLRDNLSGEMVAGKYAVSKGIFAAHDQKFARASEDLPLDCTEILRVVTVTSNPKYESTTISYPADLHESGLFEETDLALVSVPGYSTGTLADATGYGSVVPVSISERLRSFYVDWDDHNKQWKGEWYSQDQLDYQFVPDVDALIDAAICFKQHLRSILDAL